MYGGQIEREFQVVDTHRTHQVVNHLQLAAHSESGTTASGERSSRFSQLIARLSIRTDSMPLPQDIREGQPTPVAH